MLGNQALHGGLQGKDNRNLKAGRRGRESSFFPHASLSRPSLYLFVLKKRCPPPTNKNSLLSAGPICAIVWRVCSQIKTMAAKPQRTPCCILMAVGELQSSGFKLPFSAEAEVHPKPINKSSPAPPIGVLAERPREFCDMCHPHLRAVIVASHGRGLELGVHMLRQWKGGGWEPPSFFENKENKEKFLELFPQNRKVTHNSPPIDADVWHLSWIPGKHGKL